MGKIWAVVRFLRPASRQTTRTHVGHVFNSPISTYMYRCPGQVILLGRRGARSKFAPDGNNNNNSNNNENNNDNNMIIIMIIIMKMIMIILMIIIITIMVGWLVF